MQMFCLTLSTMTQISTLVCFYLCDLCRRKSVGDTIEQHDDKHMYVRLSATLSSWRAFRHEYKVDGQYF